MNRFGFIALSLCLFSLAACAISEPNPTGKKNQGNVKDDPDTDPSPTDAKDNPSVVMETSMGTVKMLLFQDKSPISVKNFLKYVDAKHYDGTVFHRVIPGFMIQGGGFEPGMREKSDKFPPIRNEAGNRVRNSRGTLAMARTPDPDSATAQFFINTADNLALDRDGAADRFGYAVFGKVVEGMEVVEKIEAVRTGTRAGHQNVPVENVTIQSIRRVDAK